MLLQVKNITDIVARLPNVVRLGTPKTKKIIHEFGEIRMEFDRPGTITYAIGQSMEAYYRGNPYLLANGTEQYIPDDGLVSISVDHLGVGSYTLFFSTVDVDNENRSAVFEYDFVNAEEIEE